MIEFLDQSLLLDSTKLFIQIMLVFVFCLSVFLLVGPAMFTKVAQRLQERHGALKKELFPRLEGDIMILDQLLFNQRKLISTVIIILSLIGFILIK